MNLQETVDAVALRDLAVRLAREAGALLADRRPVDLGVSAKSSPSDYVTVMDQAAERLVVDGLLAERPHDAILGEEGGATTGTSGVRWVIDPLDGTVNYVYGIPAFGVSIAAEVDGTVVAGAVHDPVHGTTYEAVRGCGSRVDGRALTVSAVESLDLTLLGTGFSYSAATRAYQGERVAQLLPRVRDIRRIGAAALDLCAVAEGRLDAFYEIGLHAWDSAAGELIATEAGARSARLDTPHGQLLVVAGPGVFDDLLALLGEVHAAA